MPGQIVISLTVTIAWGLETCQLLCSQMCKLILSTVNAAITADMFAWLCNSRNCHYQKSTLGRTKWCTATACAKISPSTPLTTGLWACYSGTFEVGQNFWLKACDPQTPWQNAICLHMTIYGAGVSLKSFSSSGWKLSQLADLLRRSDSSLLLAFICNIVLPLRDCWKCRFCDT